MNTVPAGPRTRVTALVLILALVVVGLVPTTGVAVATAEAAGPPVPNYTHPVSCQTWALQGTKSERKKRLADCLQGRKMTKKGRRCLIAAGITVGGTVVGGVIGGAGARAIAGGIVGGGGGACVAAIVSG